MSQRTLLVVDDDTRLRERLSAAFAERGYRVLGAADHEEATELARGHRIDRAIVDLRMPGPHGLVVVRDLIEIHPEIEIVVLTGYGSIATAIEAVRLGATHYLTKPADTDEILAAFVRKPGEALPETETPSLARVEWEHIQRVLTDCGGNVSEAARRLGVHRRSLQRKLGKFPVKR